MSKSAKTMFGVVDNNDGSNNPEEERTCLLSDEDYKNSPSSVVEQATISARKQGKSTDAMNEDISSIRDFLFESEHKDKSSQAIAMMGAISAVADNAPLLASNDRTEVAEGALEMTAAICMATATPIGMVAGALCGLAGSFLGYAVAKNGHDEGTDLAVLMENVVNAAMDDLKNEDVQEKETANLKEMKNAITYLSTLVTESSGAIEHIGSIDSYYKDLGSSFCETLRTLVS